MSPRAKGLLVLALLGAGLAWVGVRSRPAADPPPADRAPPGPAQPPAPPAAVASLGSAGPELDRALETFLGRVPVQGPAPTAGLLEEALREARQGSDPDPAQSYRQALERLLRERPDAGLLLARGLLADEELPELLAFQRALALSERLDAPAAAALLDGLAQAGPRARPWAVFALRGRRDDPRVQDALLDRYAQDPSPAVRAKAGFVLGEGGAALDPRRLERAREVARADLSGEDAGLIASAADVLGIPPLAPPDRRLLETTLERDRDPRRREAALRALAGGGVSLRELAPLLERVARDPAASEALRMAAQAAREAASGE